MVDYSIALTGIRASQNAIEIIGNNIANAATEGYHKQRVELSPSFYSQNSSISIGGGVHISGITRLVDGLLEQELLRQRSTTAQLSEEIGTLRIVENAFGELMSEDGGLNAAMDNFFASLSSLTSHSTQPIWQNETISSALSMTSQFNTLGNYLTSLQDQIYLEAQSTISQANLLIQQIADLNSRIQSITIGDNMPNNLMDQRDQAIAKLSDFIGLEVSQQKNGVTNIVAGGIPVVIGAQSFQIELGLNTEQKLGIGAARSLVYDCNISGGKLGGLLSLSNDYISKSLENLNDLANGIIIGVNQLHAQGVGSGGSFRELSGWTLTTTQLNALNPPVSSGSLYIRVTNTSTGEVTRHEIEIDASSDSLADVAAKIEALTGLSSWIENSKLLITADANYTFDFLPGVLSTPQSSTLTNNIEVSGIYNAISDELYTFSILSDGSVGVTDGLSLKVTNSAGQIVKTVNIGSGYAAGERIEIDAGFYISVGSGAVLTNQNFTVEAICGSDNTGVLAATGINCFFQGSSANNIGICQEIIDSPNRIATARGSEFFDSANASLMAKLKTTRLASLRSMTPNEFYRTFTTELGLDLDMKELREKNSEQIMQNLLNRQSEVSGVDINEQAALLMVYEQMFQGMAKYMATIQSTLSDLMSLI